MLLQRSVGVKVGYMLKRTQSLVFLRVNASSFSGERYTALFHQRQWATNNYMELGVDQNV